MLDRIGGVESMDNHDDPDADRNRDPSDDENMNMNIPEVDNEMDDDFDEDDLDHEFGPQEFSALNNQLDQLQTALDSLESRNDDIHSKLLELLRSSREVRQVMTEENNLKRNTGEPDDESDPNKGASSASGSNAPPQGGSEV